MYIRCEAERRVAELQKGYEGGGGRNGGKWRTFLAAIIGHCESLLHDYDDYYYCNRYYPIIVTIIIIVIEYY